MNEIRPFVVIQDWMFDLGLNISEVLAVAVIYGFTQDGRHTCHASLAYFQRRCCLTKRGALKMLARLEGSGLVKVSRASGKENEYEIDFEVVNKVHQCNNCTGELSSQSGELSSLLSSSSPHTPLTTPIFDKKDKKEINAHMREGAAGSTSPATEKEGQDEATLFDTEKQASVGDGAPQSQGKKKGQKSCAAPFVPPTLAEVREYIEKVRRSPIDPVAFFAHYENNDWRLSSGRRMKDWRLAVVTWERRDRNGWGR